MRAMAREPTAKHETRATRRALPVQPLRGSPRPSDMRLALIALLFVSACAHDVFVRYPAAPDDPTGTVVLLLSQPASDVNVAINGMLVVQDAHTDRIVNNNAPAGTEDIVITANGGDKEMKLWVGTDHATTVPIGVPDATSGFLKTLFGTLVTITAYSLLH